MSRTGSAICLTFESATLSSVAMRASLEIVSCANDTFATPLGQGSGREA
jgi:hypothetical protein